MSEEKKNPLLERKVIDSQQISVSKIGGVNKATVPKKFRDMHLLKTFFEKPLEMRVIIEDGLPFLEIRRVEP